LGDWLVQWEVRLELEEAERLGEEEVEELEQEEAMWLAKEEVEKLEQE
jgi:hypothetical protein